MQLDDQQWEKIARCFRKPRSGNGRRGRPVTDFRRVLDGIVWVLRSGAPWSEIPRAFAPPSTCFGRFQEWSNDGTLLRILRLLWVELTPNCDWAESFIDGSYVPAKAGGDVVGKCRAGSATKIMVVASGDGLPLGICIAEGSRHDVVLVEQTLDEVFAPCLADRLIADKAFDSQKLQAALADERGVELIAPTRRGHSARKQDGRAMRRYQRRWKVENLFAWLKKFRRKSQNYLGLVHLACIAIILRTMW